MNKPKKALDFCTGCGAPLKKYDVCRPCLAALIEKANAYEAKYQQDKAKCDKLIPTRKDLRGWLTVCLCISAVLLIILAATFPAGSV